jgi:hypothetical protein
MRLPSRREVLRQLGVGLGCLPLLQATRAQAAAPRRLVMVVQPFGYRTASWLPGMVGPLGAAPLPDSTSPLTPWKDQLIFLPGLTNPSLSCNACGEAAYGATFGKGGALVERFAQSSVATADQVVASGLAGKGALIPSLPLGVLVDAGRRPLPLGARRCFWRGASAPVAPEESPHALFAHLFAGTSDVEATRRLQQQKKSLLDFVGDELDRYGKRLGNEDRAVVEQHQGALRDIERDLTALPVTDPACAPSLGPPLSSHRGANFAALAELQVKLLVAALSCDVTRVVTLQLGNALGTGVSLDFVPGLPRGGVMDWYRIAQSPLITGGLDRKRLADKWFMTLFARLLASMAAAGPAGATLLDQSAVLWATTMNDGSDGNVQKLPWLLAGKCGGHLKTGQVADSAGKPLHGVLAELCNAMEVPVASFADATYGTPMAGLKA